MGSTSFWNQRFAAEGKIWGEEPSRAAPRAVELFRAADVEKVLVPGCGYGRNAVLLAHEGFDVTGVDPSREALEIARQADPQVRWIEASALDPASVDGTFDAVYASNVLHLFLASDRRKLIDNCRHWLRPGGVVFTVVFSDVDFTCGRGEQVEPNTFESRPGRPAHYFSEPDMRDHFAAFEVLETGLIDEPEDHPPDGQHVHQLRYLAARVPQ